ncbi:MAG: glycosyltransferase [Methanophagales archaeon]|nr:glycosyltransferase [Methanophagales archaeon]MCW7072941.1 glycosyltransferase [Methanophagales archaeon]
MDKSAMKERFCGSRSAKMILFPGRLVYQKGVNVLIGVLSRVLAACPDARLVIVGEGPMRRLLERDVSFLGIKKDLVFTGHLDDWAVRCLLKAADVLVVPSVIRTFWNRCAGSDGGNGACCCF